MDGLKLNRIVLSIFAPVLILAGVAGFLIPAQYSLTSGAAPYNLFHIVFGELGLFIVSGGKPQHACIFNVGFGLIDIYWAIASALSLWPDSLFLWTYVDDVLHIIIGFGLVIIGLYGIGIFKTKKERP